MRNRLDDRQLSEGLKHLTRYPTSDDFTQKLMEEIAARSAKPGNSSLRLLRMAAAGLIVAVGFWIGASALDRRRDEQAYRQRLDAIRNQYQQIQVDMDDLRRQAATSPAVVYLGGNESFDLVVDLADLTVYEAVARAPLTLPASYQP